jgi:hypothetical protein
MTRGGRRQGSGTQAPRHGVCAVRNFASGLSGAGPPGKESGVYRTRIVAGI